MARTPRKKTPPAPKGPGRSEIEAVSEKRTEGRPSHVVAVAGSAGSLDAIKQFFGALAGGSGAAFVVCVHRDARAPNLLAELVAGFTSMPVCLLKTGTSLSPDTVYVLAANRSLALASGEITLGPRDRSSGQINELFRAIAADERGNAVGILLSGMDSDGTLGLEAIRTAGGHALVQTPGSAPFPAMPESAIAAGASDIVGSPEDLARELTTLLVQPFVAQVATDQATQDRALEAILRRIHEHTGHDLSHYKRSPFLRRVERRMSLRHMGDYPSYLALLEREPAESKQLFKDLLIGVTRFFREPDAFEVLRTTALPRILADQRRAPPLRIWIAGCSTGEEAYSIAMVAREALDALPNKADRALQIYATDLDEVAIERARRGRYPASIAEDISPARLERFFTKSPEGYHVRAEIRDSVVFATHDLTAHPPFTRLDLVCCRNVLIYMGVEAQRKLLALFHFALRNGGVLVLGGSESLGTWERAFEVVDSKTRVYRRREVARSRRLPVEFPLQASSMALLPNADEPTRLLPADSIRELVRVALEELGAVLPTKQRTSGRLLGKKKAKGSSDRGPTELENLRRHLVTLTQNLESFRREAQVTHEELQSTNEELQSTNEELVTAREETQSMNEELLSLNAELSAKNEALEVTNDDMRNLLDGSLIPTVFLDDALRIRRFTSQATRIAHLLPTDVGRPVTDIVLLIGYPDLARDVREVLATHESFERPVESTDGSMFTMRIHPYRTAHDGTEGVVMSFLDVTALAHAGSALCTAARREVAAKMVGVWVGIAYVTVPSTGECIASSPGSAALLGYEAPVEGTAFDVRLHHPDDREPAADGVWKTRQIRHGDGEIVPYRERNASLAGETGDDLRFTELLAGSAEALPYSP